MEFFTKNSFSFSHWSYSANLYKHLGLMLLLCEIAYNAHYCISFYKLFCQYTYFRFRFCYFPINLEERCRRKTVWKKLKILKLAIFQRNPPLPHCLMFIPCLGSYLCVVRFIYSSKIPCLKRNVCDKLKYKRHEKCAIF